MVGAMSLIGIFVGAAAANFAERFHAYRATIEASAGILLIGGLALLGSALPAIL
jgi:hypothetical protein